MAVRFEYEWHDESGKWFRSYDNELWESLQAASCGGVKRALVICRSRRMTESFCKRTIRFESRR